MRVKIWRCNQERLKQTKYVRLLSWKTLLELVCPSAPILQNKSVTKLSHQNIVPKSQGSRLIRNHPPALSCHTFLAVLAQSIPFCPFCTYLHLRSIYLLYLWHYSVCQIVHMCHQFIPAPWSITMMDGLNTTERKCVTVI